MRSLILRTYCFTKLQIHSYDKGTGTLMCGHLELFIWAVCHIIFKRRHYEGHLIPQLSIGAPIQSGMRGDST